MQEGVARLGKETTHKGNGTERSHQLMAMEHIKSSCSSPKSLCPLNPSDLRTVILPLAT